MFFCLFFILVHRNMHTQNWESIGMCAYVKQNKQKTPAFFLPEQKKCFVHRSSRKLCALFLPVIGIAHTHTKDWISRNCGIKNCSLYFRPFFLTHSMSVMYPGPIDLRFPLMSSFHHNFPWFSVITQNMSYVQVLSNLSGTFNNVWNINVLMSCDIVTCNTTNINNDWMMIIDKIPELIRFPLKGVKSQYLVFIWNWSTWFIDCVAFGNFYFVTIFDLSSIFCKK